LIFNVNALRAKKNDGMIFSIVIKALLAKPITPIFTTEPIYSGDVGKTLLVFFGLFSIAIQLSSVQWVKIFGFQRFAVYI